MSECPITLAKAITADFKELDPADEGTYTLKGVGSIAKVDNYVILLDVTPNVSSLFVLDYENGEEWWWEINTKPSTHHNKS